MIGDNNTITIKSRTYHIGYKCGHPPVSNVHNPFIKYFILSILFSSMLGNNCGNKVFVIIKMYASIFQIR